MRKLLFLLVTVSFIFNSFSQKKTYEIGFLLDTKNSETEVLLANLKNEITAVVGEDATLKFSETNTLVNNFNETKALTNHNTLLNNNSDLIIAFGVVNNSAIAHLDNYPKPVILFGALSQELLKETKPISKSENLISIVSAQSYAKDLALLQKISKPKLVGVVAEKSLVENMPMQKIFSQIGSQLDIDTKMIPYDRLSDITSNLEDIDAVYLAGGFYLSDSEIKQLAATLISKKIPSFTTTTVNDVEIGLLATNQSSSGIDQFFRHIALTVEGIVNNTGTSTSNEAFGAEENITINYNTANKIGVPLKYSLIATTNFVGNPNERISDKKYNLVEVMQDAIKQNLDLRTEEKNVLLSEKDVKNAKSNYLPNITASASGTYIDPDIAEISNGQNPEFSTSGNIALSQTVFSEANNANISIQKSLLEAQRESYNSESLNTVFNSANAYFNALILKANAAIQVRNLELTKYNLKIAQENFDAGESGKSDVLRFRSEMAQNTQDMVEAINQLEQAYYALNQLLNNPINYEIDVEETELSKGIFSDYKYEQLGQFLDDPTLRTPFVKFLVEEAKTNAPELKSLYHNLQATRRSEKLYGSGRFLPTVALQGQYNYEFSRSGQGTEFPAPFAVPPDDNYNVGLSVSIPIFNQNKTDINKQIAKIQKDQLEISKENVELGIERNINDAVLSLINQISNIELSKVSESTAKEALDLTQTAYANGAVNIIQLLDAQNNYLQAQLSQANAVYNYFLSSMSLERSLGVFFLLQTPEERAEFVGRFLEFSQNNNN